MCFISIFEQGLFSEGDSSDSIVLANYIAFAILSPCRLIMDFWWSENSDVYITFKNLLAIKYRIQSAFSFNLIKTYKKLGFMAPIPKDMEKWSPSLFKLLTVDLFLTPEFQKKTGPFTYTCTNIPVLVAIVVYLAVHDIIFIGDKLILGVKELFNTKGAYKVTNGWRNEKPPWPTTVNRSWANTLQMKFSIGKAGTALELLDIICLLLYGRTHLGKHVKKLQPTWRAEVDEVIQGLSAKKLLSMLTDGKWKKDKDTTMQAKPAAAINPFLSKPQIQAIHKLESNQAKVAMMSELAKNHLAKAMNLFIHMEMHTQGSAQVDDVADANDKNDFGRLNFLKKPKAKSGKPKEDEIDKSGEPDEDDSSDDEEEKDDKPTVQKTSNVPQAFQALQSLESLMTSIVGGKVDYTAKPSEVWESVAKIPVEEWLAATPKSTVEQPKSQPAVKVPRIPTKTTKPVGVETPAKTQSTATAPSPSGGPSGPNTPTISEKTPTAALPLEESSSDSGSGSGSSSDSGSESESSSSTQPDEQMATTVVLGSTRSQDVTSPSPSKKNPSPNPLEKKRRGRPAKVLTPTTPSAASPAKKKARTGPTSKESASKAKKAKAGYYKATPTLVEPPSEGLIL
jgi:hypothetical protein